MNLFFNSLFIRTDFFLANTLMTDDFFFPDSYAGQSLWDSRHIYSDHSNPKEGPQKRLEKEITKSIKTILQQVKDRVVYHPVARHHLLG